MKKLVLLFALAVVAFSGFAQPNVDTVPAYRKNPNIPAFSIEQPDSTWFTNNDIPKNKPVIIIYFSPECGHCQLAAQDIYNHIDDFKDAFLIWVSYFSVPEIKTFTVNYKLGSLSNFRFGRDPKYALPTFYHVRFTPFMAIYDKHGKFVQAFEQGAEAETLSKVIKGLN